MKLAPSILAADLADLRGAAAKCRDGGADLLHVDVMDGRFVPNLTFGPPVVAALRRATDMPLDVHLMVAEPDRMIDATIAAGAAWISVHFEATLHLERVLSAIREGGAKAGVALNPTTPVEHLRDTFGALDFVLLMSVNPGFAGQRFIRSVLDKAARLRAMIDAEALPVTIEMDGGIGPENIRRVVEAGVDVCVAGSATFRDNDPAGALQLMRRRAEGEIS